MNIYQILKKEHQDVKGLFEKALMSHEKGKGEDILSELKSELSEHMDSEEKIFYPRLENEEDAREKTLEAYEEHHVTKQVMQELLKMSSSDERWMAKLAVMKELVTHHVDEEEKSVFKSAKSILDKKEAQEIGDQYKEEKDRLMKMRGKRTH